MIIIIIIIIQKKSGKNTGRGKDSSGKNLVTCKKFSHFSPDFFFADKVCKSYQKALTLKPVSHLSKIITFICFNENPLKMMKNAFYFILKALFVLKILKFLSRRFGHVEETD